MMITTHSRFVLKPVESFMHEAVNACCTLNDMIDAYPACEYLFQSLLLRMTGAQEQKLRCICWDVSTYDYAFRYKYMKSAGGLGQYSSYDNKKTIFDMLVDGNPPLFSDDWKTSAIDDIVTTLNEIVENSLLRNWKSRMFAEYKRGLKLLKNDYFCHDNQLLLSPLYDIYDKLYDERNRYAHNVYSYQENLPTLRLLSENSGNYQNYYMWIAVLMLLDRVFIHLYKENMRRIELLE